MEDAQLSQPCVQARLALNKVTSAVTKDNLENNDSALANQLRLDQAQSKVDRMAAVFADTSYDQLPKKTKRQLLEDKSGLGPMQRFLETADDRAGNPMDTEVWNDLKLHDPLAAELDLM